MTVQQEQIARFFRYYDQYFDPVYRYAIRRVGHSDYLKRVVNRTFYRAFHQFENFFESRVEFRPWILRYAKVVADEMGVPMRANVDNLLVDLEQEDLEIVFFKTFEKLPDAEAAYVLDIEEQTFVPRYYRLLAKLKTKMSQND